jgi:hypothetical protein
MSQLLEFLEAYFHEVILLSHQKPVLERFPKSSSKEERKLNEQCNIRCEK